MTSAVTKRPRAELRGERFFDRRHGLGERKRPATRVAIRAHGNRRQKRGFEAMAHGIEDRDVCAPFAERVVEDVAADLIRRLDEAAHDHALAADRERRHERPLHLRGERHRSQPSRLRQGVAVGGLAQQDLSQQRRESLGSSAREVIKFAKGQAERAEAIHAVQQRQPQAPAAGNRDLLNVDLAEGAPRDTAVDPDRRLRGGEGNQHLLAVIDQQHLYVSPTEVLRRCGRGFGEPLGSQEPTEPQQLPEGELARC